VLIGGLITQDKKGEPHSVARQLSWKKELLWSKWKSLVLLWRLSKEIICIHIKRQPYKNHDGKSDKAKAVIDPF
jgi:hypothetical protein